MSVKFVLMFALSGFPPAPVIEGEKVYRPFVAEFTTQEACSEFYWRVIRRDDFVAIYADDKPCGWDKPPIGPPATETSE